MNIYGLREARALIAADRKSIASEFPRSNDPYVKGMRDALKALDNRIALRMEMYKKRSYGTANFGIKPFGRTEG